MMDGTTMSWVYCIGATGPENGVEDVHQRCCVCVLGRSGSGNRVVAV